MSRKVLNTLYVMTQGSRLRKDHETLVVEVDGEKTLQVPQHHLGSVVVFGGVYVSQGVYTWASEEGKPITFLSTYGKFRGRFVGPTSGNVHLRVQQFEANQDGAFRVSASKAMVAAKIQNSRFLLLRHARDRNQFEDSLRRAEKEMGSTLEELEEVESLDDIRGMEGQASRLKFQVFDRMLTQNRDFFAMKGRNRRPPRDPMNAILSFLYTIIRHDVSSALESVGLDPQVGLMHVLRSGRPALALDLMEEFRPVLGDRLAVTLVNRQQLKPDDFKQRSGGAVEMTEEGRKTLLEAYQKRKDAEVSHPVMENPLPLGLVPQVQARLLARVIRGELEEYPPFLYRG